MLKNYRKNKTDYIAILGRDQFESLELITQSWLKGYRIKLVGDKAYHNASYISRHIPFLGRYIMNSIAEYKIDCKSYHGLWPEVNNEVRSLTLKFYKHYVKPKFKLIDYYNRILKTEKFEAFVQKAITYEIFDLLEQFYPIKPNSKSKKLLMIKNPINKFIIEIFTQVPLLTDLKITGFQVPTAFSSEVTALLDNDRKIYFSTDHDCQQQINNLIVVYQKKLRGEAFEYIDLRFGEKIYYK